MAPSRAVPHLLSQRSSYICRNCLLTSRFHSSKTSPPPQPPSSAFVILPTRRLISLSGPDATKYLQGAITANLATERTTGFYAAFLNAKGRILNDVFIYPEINREGWLIEVDAKEAETLAGHIKRYKLRAKFEVRLLEEGERGVWCVWKDEVGWTSHSLDAGKKDSTGVGCEDKRAPGMGRRVILPMGQKPEEDLEEVDEGVYRVRRYLRGVAEGQDEMTRESALPQESNIDFMGGLDYRKGCYVGQELTIRTHHTGVIRKRILPVMLYGLGEPVPDVLEYKFGIDFGVGGIPVETSIGRFEKRGRSAGKYLAGVGNIGLGLCRLEIMTDTQIQGDGGGYKEGDEFKLDWELEGTGPQMVKLKAFVPPWHLTKH